MGFFRWIRRFLTLKPNNKFSTTSATRPNNCPSSNTRPNNYPSRSYSHAPNFPLTYTLAQFKQNPTQYQTQDLPDLRKYFAMHMIQDIRSKKKRGVHSGSLALHHIIVRDSTARIPCDTIYDPAVHKDYIEGYPDFFIDLYSGNEPVDDPNYVDLKSYMMELKTLRQLLLLLLHPYFQHTGHALRFISSALKVLEGLEGKTFQVRYQAPAKSHKTPLTWRHVYSDLRKEGEEINISKSINRLSSDQKKAFQGIYDRRKKDEYIDTDAIHELKFYKRVSTQHAQPHTLDDLEKEQALNKGFFSVSQTMFRFFVLYDGCFDGAINLDIIYPLEVSLQLNERINSETKLEGQITIK